MNYIGWIVLGTYLVSWILASRHIFRCVDDAQYTEDSDTLLALLVGFVWPIGIPLIWATFGTPDYDHNPIQTILDFVVGRKRS